MLTFTPRGQRNKLGFYQRMKGQMPHCRYSFVGANGVRLPSTSKYMPHQGEREIARRLKRKGII